MATPHTPAGLAAPIGNHLTPSAVDTRRSTPVEMPTEPNVIQPNDDEKKREAERQAWFQNAANAELKVSNVYQKVSVLIARWDKDEDDFPEGHDAEIGELEELFKNGFHYDCEIVELGTSTRPQIKLNAALAAHVSKHDGPNNLLIVYYTGHGQLHKAKDAEMRLELSAKGGSSKEKSTKEKNKYPPSLFWDKVEDNLFDVEGDVFVLFDCCFGSNAHKGFIDERRLYWLMAASPRYETTPAPGPHSFTTALIQALRKLLDECNGQNFTTMKLMDEINMSRNPDNPGPPCQLWDRFHKRYDRHIQLAPLNKGASPKSRRRSIGEERACVKLRFSLYESPHFAQDDIERWARALVTASQETKIPLRGIEWTKMDAPSSRLPRVVRAISACRYLKRKRQHSEMALNRSPTALVQASERDENSAIESGWLCEVIEGAGEDESISPASQCDGDFFVTPSIVDDQDRRLNGELTARNGLYTKPRLSLGS
ncbi:hypothetical protein P154DRAFT_521115 [Amniculicola lignicola CBS 123094]|uniref:Uncharacterized protein n=1 Tax=Amniculicola lignicola CBS 123094 TaxID=1392246 RepID=A0A6A5WKC6_9PLEO|nr:hypothetical protein P154DRAFT_521115 [Amniculicola lignicola CBS 123094]